MTSPEFTQPGEYHSERGATPYVSEIEIVNDIARILGEKGKRQSLALQQERFSRLSVESLEEMGVGTDLPEDVRKTAILAAEAHTNRDLEARTGLRFDQPIVVEEGSQFGLYSKTNPSDGDLAEVPKGAELHGQIGPATTIIFEEGSPYNEPGEQASAPSFILKNPVLLSADGQPLELGANHIIKVPLASELLRMSEGVYHEPSMRDEDAWVSASAE